ncbi:uncharacterized protein J3R85_015871 [Psidium guajava]|nr:uncharacterized protein J3R85_015871 [Psidium guajava]
MLERKRKFFTGFPDYPETGPVELQRRRLMDRWSARRICLLVSADMLEEAFITGFAKTEKAGSPLELETLAVLSALRKLEEREGEDSRKSAQKVMKILASYGVVQEAKIFTHDISIPYHLANPDDGPWAFRSIFLECNTLLAHLKQSISGPYSPTSKRSC